MSTDRQPSVLLAGTALPASEVRLAPGRFQGLMRRARETHAHALCLCRMPKHKLKLQVRERERKLHLAAWPDQAHLHSTACPFYSERDAYSGRKNQPIHDSDGQSRVDLAKPLTYSCVPAPPALPAAQKPVAKPVPMWGLLHHLWDVAGLNRWRGGWIRNWEFARHAILRAAETTSIGGKRLSTCLYIPPSFSPQRRDDIESRWQTFVRPLLAAPRGGRTVRSGLVLGLVRSTERIERATKLLLRQHSAPMEIPDGLAEHLAARCRRGWGALAHLHKHGDTKRVVFFGRIEASRSGSLIVTDAVLMPTNGHLIPCNNDMEIQIADELMSEGREFVRPLSFEASQGTLPSFVHRDFNNEDVLETEMYCVPSGLPWHVRDRVLVKRGEDALGAGHSIWFWVQDESRVHPPFPPYTQR